MPFRTIEQRHTGDQHGFIRRLISPGDLGERLKPFVFLDYLHGHVPDGAGFGFHPHSGIATLTYQIDADVAYEDTAGQKGIVRATGLEWMLSGGGTWHQGFIHPHGDTATGFQLWVALPPGVEDGEPVGNYIAPEDVPQIGSVRLLLGEYRSVRNPIVAPASMTYLDLVLPQGGTWEYQPPASHRIAWAYVYRGKVVADGKPTANELLVFDESSGALKFDAHEPSRILLGTAEKHEHPLVLGSSSVHTSRDSLKRALERLRTIRDELQRGSRL